MQQEKTVFDIITEDVENKIRKARQRLEHNDVIDRSCKEDAEAIEIACCVMKMCEEKAQMREYADESEERERGEGRECGESGKEHEDARISIKELIKAVDAGRKYCLGNTCAECKYKKYTMNCTLAFYTDYINKNRNI